MVSRESIKSHFFICHCSMKDSSQFEGENPMLSLWDGLKAFIID